MFLAAYNATYTRDGIPLITRGLSDYKANPTMAAGDVQISKDGGDWANITTLPTVTPASGTAVRIALSAGEMTAKQIAVRFIDQTSPKEWEDQQVLIETYGHVSAQHPNIGASAATIADAVWDEPAPEHLAAGSVGAKLQTIDSNVTATGIVVGNLSDVIDTKASQASVDLLATTAQLEALQAHGDTAWATGDLVAVSILPLSVTVSAGEVRSPDLVAYLKAGFAFTFAYHDDSTPPEPIDLSGKDLVFIVTDLDGNEKFSLTSEATQIVIGGEHNNQATVVSTNANTQAIGDFEYTMRIVETNKDPVISIASFVIRRAGVKEAS